MPRDVDHWVGVDSVRRVNQKPRWWRGKRFWLWLRRINRRKGGERRWWWGERGRTEREQERRIEPVELVGPGAAVSAVRFPAAASSERARLLAMRSCQVGLGAAGC